LPNSQRPKPTSILFSAWLQKYAFSYLCTMTVWEGAALVAGGFAAGIINTLAGNGSAITLSLLLASGMGGQAANATNRVGVLLQTLASLTGLRKSRKKSYLLRQGTVLYLPTMAVG
jgi:uncharacterized membrane protein YfcA